MRDSFRRDPIPCHPRHPFPKSLEEETKPPTWLIHAVEICDFFFSLFSHLGFFILATTYLGKLGYTYLVLTASRD